MATQRRTAVRFTLTGAKRRDPGPRALRKAFGLKERRAELEKVVKNAGKPMAESMKQGAPVDTGKLAHSFGVQKSKKQSSFRKIAYFVGARTGRSTFAGGKRFAGWRAHWAELGTVNHPGEYFIQPAIKKNTPVAIRLIREGVLNLVRRSRGRLTSR